ncbi:TonB-dependent siderophore receptor [Luteolibacter yonseiensis]|uniref:TonB-dependent siderophore receptor n=1 Tax=Luteolibacter yonseiensis TaxID=1144680 RepID=A0A934R4W0_9BACT|nr:TonB-dependent siderophore receptor [Luteolibacter yonseiensis]MBK1816987.1 TonB-dependent siderophore receptor [Luteolibacter yonseiensis]
MHINRTSKALATGLLAFSAAPALVNAQAQSNPNQSGETGTLPTLVVKAKAGSPYAVKKTTTATKTDTPLIDTPQSVTVLSEQFLKDTAVNSIGDAVRYVPGVGTAQGEGNRDTVVFRGSSSTGDYFVDGLRDDVQYYRDFYNIEQVDVLKGPSGMIFGRGGPGGVLNRVTKQAVIGEGSSYEVSGLAGSWDQYRTTFDVNQSLDDEKALRLNGLYENSDSYRDGVYNERVGVNPTFGWAISDQTTLRLAFEYFTDERTADRGIPSFNGKPYNTDESTFFGDPDRSPTDVEVLAFTASLDHKFTENITLRNSTRYASYDKFYQNVFASSAVGATTPGMLSVAAYNNATERENFLNQTDVTFKFDTGSIGHTLLTGMELSRQETDNYRETGYVDPAGTIALGSGGTGMVSAKDPLYHGPLFFRQSATDADNNSVAEGVALYVQDQVQLLPQLQLIAGLRVDFLDVDFHNNRTGEDIETSDDLFSPRLGLVYKPIENLALYTSYARSNVPRAGEQLASLSATNASLDPEEFENYEIGAKWDATQRLSFTVAAFQLNRTNQAVVDPTDSTKLILVDGQEVKGIELGATGLITDRWSISAGYAYQEGETQSSNGLIASGTPIQQLPKNSFSLWNRYDFNEHWGVGIGAIYRDEIYAAADNAVTLPDFVRFDAGLFYRHDDHLSAQLNVENLFNEEYYSTAHSNDNITPGSPIAFRLGLTYKF